MEGTIKTLVSEKGFGFITIEGEEKDLFFHKNEVKGVTFEELKVGDKVSFEKGESPKGPNAVNVTRV
jgi:CspA family cold shock protein